MITPLPGATDLKPGSATLPFFGVEPAVLDEQGKELEGPCQGYALTTCPCSKVPVTSCCFPWLCEEPCIIGLLLQVSLPCLRCPCVRVEHAKLSGCCRYLVIKRAWPSMMRTLSGALYPSGNGLAPVLLNPLCRREVRNNGGVGGLQPRLGWEGWMCAAGKVPGSRQLLYSRRVCSRLTADSLNHRGPREV